MNSHVPAALLQYMAGLKEHDLENIGSSLSEGVQFITSVAKMGKSKVLKLLAALYVGFSDWHYSHSVPELLEDGSFAYFGDREERILGDWIFRVLSRWQLLVNW